MVLLLKGSTDKEEHMDKDSTVGHQGRSINFETTIVLGRGNK